MEIGVILCVRCLFDDRSSNCPEVCGKYMTPRFVGPVPPAHGLYTDGDEVYIYNIHDEKSIIISVAPAKSSNNPLF
jgi:hypothetical protein